MSVASLFIVIVSAFVALLVLLLLFGSRTPTSGTGPCVAPPPPKPSRWPSTSPPPAPKRHDFRCGPP
ncbi:MAG: hypothetical protein AAB554_01810 [Patescibacteria group bacterium]